MPVYKLRLYHIYNDPEVKDDLTRPAQPQEPLPDLVINGYCSAMAGASTPGSGQRREQKRRRC
jgi:hypothetical protein